MFCGSKSQRSSRLDYWLKSYGNFCWFLLRISPPLATSEIGIRDKDTKLQVMHTRSFWWFSMQTQYRREPNTCDSVSCTVLYTVPCYIMNTVLYTVQHTVLHKILCKDNQVARGTEFFSKTKITSYIVLGSPRQSILRTIYSTVFSTVYSILFNTIYMRQDEKRFLIE